MTGGSWKQQQDFKAFLVKHFEWEFSLKAISSLIPPSIPGSVSSYGKVSCCIQTYKMEETMVPLRSSPLSSLSPRCGGCLQGSRLAFLLLSPTPRALGTVSCLLSLCLLHISTARALCSPVLSPQSQQEPPFVSFAGARSAPSIPPSLLPSCSHSLGDELFTLSTC